MTNARSLIALAVLAASASLAVAQTAPANTRADVKAEARAATKAGTTDEGDLTHKDKGTEKGSGRVMKTDTTSDKSRTEVRSDARQAVKAGTTAEGERGGPAYSGRDRQADTQSTASRSEVKAKATSAVSAPAGETKTMNTERVIPPQSPAQTR